MGSQATGRALPVKEAIHATWFIWLRNIGGLLLLLYGIGLWLFQGSYILARYEEETTLSELRFFRNPWLFAFKPTMQTRIKRALYTGHVSMARILPSAWLRRLPSFSDVTDRNEILRHFSRREVAISILVAACGIVGMAMAFVALVLSPFV